MPVSALCASILENSVFDCSHIHIIRFYASYLLLASTLVVSTVGQQSCIGTLSVDAYLCRSQPNGVKGPFVKAAGVMKSPLHHITELIVYSTIDS